MELWHFMWVLAAGWGLVTAGLVGSGWAVVAGEKPRLSMLDQYHVTTPLRALALALYAPMALVRAGLDTLDDNPAFAVILLAMGTGWSFLQGVFILTTFFGYT